MAKKRGRLKLKGPTELELPDGAVYVVRPAGGGISFRLLQPRASRKATPGVKGAGPGRRPAASTVALREKLRRDKAAGRLGEPVHYVKWLIEEDTKIGLTSARTVVYRELKAVRAS